MTDAPDNLTKPPAAPPTPAGPPPAASAPKQPFPTWKQVLAMMFGGLALAATACAGFLVSLGGNFNTGGDPILSPAAAILFVVGLLVSFLGLIFLFVRVARAMTRKGDTPAPGASGPDHPGGAA
jgi:hypothetical protein